MIKIEFNAAVTRIITPLPAGVNNTIASELTWTDRGVSYQNSKRAFYVEPQVCIYENQSFLTGLMPRVLGLLEKLMPDEEIDIKCHYDLIEPESEDIPEWAYKHQAEMTEAAIEYRRCILHAPTASGKTKAAAFILQQFRHVPCLFIVPTKGLLNKTVSVMEQMLGEPIGKIGNGKKRWERVTVAIINSIASNAGKFAPQLAEQKVVLVDECFPATTLIDGKPISEIKVGDYVTSFNPETMELEQRQVTHLFSRVAKDLVRVRAEDTNLICTPNHPIYTEVHIDKNGWEYEPKNWVAAGELKEGDRILRQVGEKGLAWYCVNSVEPYQQSDDPEGCVVYNLEVEGLHTYVADGFVVHNCHRGASAMYQTMALYCQNSSYRIGLTGTPFRPAGDDIVMEGVLGPTVWSIEEKDLAKLGVIKKPVCLLAEYQHPTQRYPGGMEINVDRTGRKLENPYYTYATKNAKPEREDVYDIGIKDNHERNSLVVDLAEAFIRNPNRIGGGLILVERLDQGRAIQRIAAQRGLEIPFISGETPVEDRDELIRQADLGRVDMFIASNILNEGEDMRALQLVLVAGGGSNAKTIIQQAGRVIRAAKDLEEELGVKKRFALVVDIYDHEPYYLRNNTISRMKPLKERYEYNGAPNVVALPAEKVIQLLETIESDEAFQNPRWLKQVTPKE